MTGELFCKYPQMYLLKKSITLGCFLFPSAEIWHRYTNSFISKWTTVHHILHKRVSNHYEIFKGVRFTYHSKIHIVSCGFIANVSHVLYALLDTNISGIPLLQPSSIFLSLYLLPKYTSYIIYFTHALTHRHHTISRWQEEKSNKNDSSASAQFGQHNNNSKDKQESAREIQVIPQSPWWCHQRETFSALLVLWEGNSPVTGEFPSQRPVTRSFEVFFDLRLKSGCINNRDVGDLRSHRAHYDVIVMCARAIGYTYKIVFFGEKVMR